MTKPLGNDRQMKRAARERFLRQVRSVRASFGADALKQIKDLAQPKSGIALIHVEDADVAALVDKAMTNRGAMDAVIASMAAIEATLAKNPSDHLLQAYYAPTYHALRVELDRLTNLALHNSEAAYDPKGEIKDATTRLQSLAERVGADTDKLGLANTVLTAITKLITALAG